MACAASQSRRTATPCLILLAALSVLACSGSEPRTQNSLDAGSAETNDGPEPHDASSFAKDPKETHLTSPDEADLHPERP